MGIKDLSDMIDKRYKQIVKVPLTLNDTIGVDISIYAMKMLRSSDNLIRDFHTKPMIDLWNHINSHWSRLCKNLKCKLVFVFDGRRNASKAA